MLISHRHRFIYTKTAKTAGTSVEAYFERFCMPEGEWTPSHGRNEYESPSGIIGYRGPDLHRQTKWRNHMSAIDIKQQIGDDTWSSYFKFCTVRNPYDKCISAFSHFGKNYSVKKQSFWERVCHGKMSPEQHRFYCYLKKHTPVDRDKYLIEGEFCLDDVIRYEHLEEDLQRICRKIGVPFELQYLPSYKKGIRQADATTISLYTEPAKKWVARKFAYELDRFGYDFPEP